MSVGLSAPESLLPVAGVTLATVEAGIRYTGRDDMVLMVFESDTTVSTVFTKNQFCAAPVSIAKAHLQQSGNSVRACIINAGNANAGTGEPGVQNGLACCQSVADSLGVSVANVLPFSTGVIGEQLPLEKMQASIPALVANLREDNWLTAAKAIMTTDTVAKGISQQVDLGDGEMITITGITKGSGMICPNMATLLVYIATDAAIEQTLLDTMTEQAVNESFNRITVDGDTSTNDALIFAATGQAAMAVINSDSDQRYAALYAAVKSVFEQLAQAVIRDAEGATKFVKVNVSGAQTEADAASIAYTVAHSPLVKTALFASDPNWGRILAAVGRAQVDHLDIDQVDITIGENVALIRSGQPADDYNEEKGQAVFDQDDIDISICVGQGGGSYHVWTSDLSHDYVSINADYRS